MKVFIIWPWWVGKSTCGSILASLLNYTFIDLDIEFCENIWNIWEFIKEYWYEKYCFKNSELFYKLLSQKQNNCVFSLSSWFLIHENLNELTSKHKQTLKDQGISILLLPSKSIEISKNIVVKRQLSRWLWLNEKRETEKFIKRYPLYKELGNIQIFSYESPEIIANKMKNEIKILQY